MEIVNEQFQHVLARILAIFNILEQKGLLKDIDVANEIAKATSQLDQEISRQKTDFFGKLKEEDPKAYGVYKFLGLTNEEEE